MSSIDPSGVDKIKSLAHEYKHVDITVCIAGASGNILNAEINYRISIIENLLFFFF